MNTQCIIYIINYPMLTMNNPIKPPDVVYVPVTLKCIYIYELILLKITHTQ